MTHSCPLLASHKVLAKQQDQIDALERTNKAMAKELQDLRAENRRLVQSDSHSKDLLMHAQHHAKSLKLTYEKQTNIIRPQLQESISSFQNDQKSLHNIKHAMAHWAERCRVLETQAMEASQGYKKAQTDLTALTQRQVAEAVRSKSLADELARQKRINIVVTAAKLESDDQAMAQLRATDAAKAELRAALIEIEHVTSKNTMLSNEFSELAIAMVNAQQRVGERDNLIASHDEKIAQLMDEHKLKDAVATELHDTIAKFLSEGMTSQKKGEFAVMQNELQDAKNENSILQNSLRMMIKKMNDQAIEASAVS